MLVSRLFSFAILALGWLSSAAISQLAVETRSVRQLDGLGKLEQIGSAYFLSADAKITVTPGALVTVETEAENVVFEVSDANRIPVEFDQLDKKTILIKRGGKSWADVTVIDFEKNIYGRKIVLVELGDVPIPPIPPDPVPPGPDPVGPFDGLAGKIRAITPGIDKEDASTIERVCRNAADRMLRFEYKQLSQAKEYIKASWPDCERCKAIYDLLADDAKDRQLSWLEAQQYYLEVAKGVSDAAR